MAINRFAKCVCRALSQEVVSELHAVAERHGLNLCARGGNFNDTYYTMKLEFAVKTPEGEVLTPERVAYKEDCEYLNLKPEWLGQSFTRGGETYSLLGLRRSSRKYPMVLQQSNGSRVKATVSFVREGFSAS